MVNEMFMLRQILLVAITIFLSSCVKDDRTWVETKFPNVLIRNIIWGNNQFYAVGLDISSSTNYDSNSSTNNKGKITILISSDGKNWSQNNTGIVACCWNINWTNNRFILVYKDIVDKQRFFASSDGVNWAEIIGNLIPGNAIIYDGKQYLTNARAECGQILSSQDLVTWSVYSQANSSWCFGLSLFHQGKYIGGGHFKGQDNTRAIFKSDNGLVWSEIKYFQGKYITEMLFANNEFIFVGDFGGIYTSPDGENWTDHSLFMGPIFDHVARGLTDYVFIPRCVTARCSMEIWSTPDFWSWKQYIYRKEVSVIDSRDYDRFMGGVATNGSTYVVVGYEGFNWKDPDGGYNGVILTSP